jgi:signal transduction histidine kinase
MKQSLRTRLALSYLVVILMSMGIVAPLAWQVVEGLYLNTQSTSLLAQAQLVASALSAQAPEGAAGPYLQTSNLAPGIHTRVIDPQGGAVIDLQSPTLPQASLQLPQLAQNAAGVVNPEELMNRPEIAQARQGKPETAIRSLEGAGGKRVLYAAAPVLAGDGSVVQIVYLATPLPDTSLSALPEALRWGLLGVLLGAVLLAGGAGLLLARRIARPLANLADAAKAVAEGDLAQQVPEGASIRELDVLGRAFNHMTASLRQSDQAKTAFISDVTHELRTPLTVIKGTIETLEDGAVDDLKARGTFLASMNRETERLIRLVNDLLVLTRADAGALNLQLHSLDLAEMALQRCYHLQNRAALCKVTLKVVVPDQAAPAGAYEMMADPDRIAQVMDNLLDNAIRYAPAGSAVTITLVHSTSEVTFCVADCGPGIPAKHLPFIFERFYRADTGRDRGQGGAGLGLAIVRSLVQAHDGSVSVESVEGQGAAFTVSLPALE